MVFLNPFAWFWLLIVIPVVVFFLLKTRLRETITSSGIFWEEVFEEQRTKAFWRRLRHPLALVLSLLFVFLLIGSQLNPVLESQRNIRKTVIVFDHSASMKAAAPGEKSRFEEAKSVLQKLITTREANRETAIITAGGEPNLLIGFTDHPSMLKQAVRNIVPSDSPGSLADAIALAKLLVQEDETAEILVITDGCATEIETDSRQIKYFPVGKPLDNIAITRFQPRRSLAGAIEYETLLEVGNFGEQPTECRIELSLDGKMVDLITFSLEPGERKSEIVRSETELGGILQARLDLEDALESDNAAWAILPPKPLQKIWFYGEDDFFLSNVLEAQVHVEVEKITDLESAIASGVPRDTVLVLHRSIPEKLPHGNLLIVDPQNGCNLFELGEPIESPLVGTGKQDSPLLEFVQLEGTHFPGARKWTWNENIPEPPNVLLATPEEEPIYVQWIGSVNAATGRNDKVLLVNTEIRRSELALKTAFPIMLSHAMSFYRGQGGEWEPTYRTGNTVAIPLPERMDTAYLKLRSPSGAIADLNVDLNQPLVRSFSECGIWEICDANLKPLRSFPCNLTDAGESDLRQASESFYALKDGVYQRSAAGLPIRFWLLVSAFVLISLEWFLYHRRWVE